MILPSVQHPLSLDPCLDPSSWTDIKNKLSVAVWYQVFDFVLQCGAPLCCPDPGLPTVGSNGGL